MKKLVVIVSLIFAGMAVNAQLYMGAWFDIGFNKTNADNGTKLNTSASFGCYADIGYRLTDVWDIGAEFGGTNSVYKNHISDTKTTSAQFLLSPYVRYSVIQAGKFELMGKGALTLDGSKTYYQIGLQVTPVLAYNLNEHIALQTNLNFISFGLSYNKEKDGNARTNFNLGGNSNNVATLGGLTIGFVYKF